MIKYIFFIYIFSLGYTQNSEKIILNEDIQDYLFLTESILEDYIKLEDELFLPSEVKDYKSISDSLVSINEKLEKTRNHFHKVFKQDVNEKENNLIMFVDDYISKLSDTII